MRKSFLGAGAVALVLVVSVFAWLVLGDDDDGSPQRPATDRAAVASAYTAYWKTYVKVLNPPTKDPAALARVLADPELGRVRQLVATRLDAHQGVRGSHGHAVLVVSLTHAKATIEDCLKLRTTLYDTRTSKKIRREPAGPFAISVAMVKDGDTWKVSRITAGSFPCPRPVPPTEGAAQ